MKYRKKPVVIEATRRFLGTAKGCEAMSGLTIAKRVKQLIAKHGTLRKVSRVVEIDAGYLSRLASGIKTNPGKDTLRRLGLREVVYYERTKS